MGVLSNMSDVDRGTYRRGAFAAGKLQGIVNYGIQCQERLESWLVTDPEERKRLEKSATQGRMAQGTIDAIRAEKDRTCEPS